MLSASLNKTFPSFLPTDSWMISTNDFRNYKLKILCHLTRYFNSLEKEGRKQGKDLFNDTLNTFYLRLCGVRHMVKDHSDSEKGNPLPPHISLLA